MAADTVQAGIGQSLREWIDDYRLSLHAAGKSKSTQSVYTLALGSFDHSHRGGVRQGQPDDEHAPADPSPNSTPRGTRR